MNVRTGPGVVIPFRPRDQVLRRIWSFRSEPAEHAVLTSAPLRIDGEVVVSRLLRGLQTVGLTFEHDQRTGDFVIRPASQERP